VKHVLTRPDQQAQRPIHQHTRESQGGVEDAEHAYHEYAPPRCAAGEQESENRQTPHGVERVMPCITRGEWQAREYQTERINQQQ